MKNVLRVGKIEYYVFVGKMKGRFIWEISPEVKKLHFGRFWMNMV